MTAQRLQYWRELCAWLEDQPYNACYAPHAAGCPHSWLLTGVSPSYRGTVDDRRRQRQIETERRGLQIVYWATGYGWRLRKDYRAKLDAHAATLVALTVN